MTTALLNSKEDMDWLFEVHVKDLAISWTPRSAVIHGNEDCPDQIDLYPRRDPLYTDVPLTGHYDAEKDGYVFCGPLTVEVAIEVEAEEIKAGR